MHQDIIYTLPPGTVNLGWTDSCAFQGFYIPDRVLCLQGHPEFDEEIEREVLVKKHGDGLLSDDVYEDAMSRIGNRHDGLVISKAMLKFLRPEGVSYVDMCVLALGRVMGLFYHLAQLG